MKNKVILIYPKFHKVDFDAKSYPLGILSIGTLLKQQKYQVKIIDFLVEDNPLDIFKKELDNSVLCVGLSVMTPQIPNALKISEIIKNYNKNIPIIWGGVHPTLFPEQTISNSLINFLITGEGELSFSKLLEFLKGESDLKNVSGLVYKKNNKIIQNKEKDLIDLNDLPLLDYSLLSSKTLKFDSIILNTSRGCPYRCAFCVNIALHNRKWRFQKPEKVLEELDYIVNKLGYKKIKFQEDNFFVDKQRVSDIVEGIKQKNLKFKWVTNCRVDYFKNDYINDQFLAKLKKSGCYKLMFGAESGSQRLLDFLVKDIKIEQIINSAKLCQKYGIRANYSFMCALPTETKKERIQTLKLIDKLLTIGPEIEIISPQPYRPYPGDELARQCEKMGYKFPEKLEDWPAVVAKSLDSSSSNLEDFSWIKNPNEIRLQRVCSVIVTSRKKMSDYIKKYPIYLAPFISLFYLLEKIRWKLKFFGLPLEYWLFIKIYWLTQTLRKNRLLEKIKNK